jgi:outer membrane protein assembly factor BamB
MSGLALALLAAIWPMYQYFPHHNAVFPGPPAVSWTHRFAAKINGGLALVNGTLYVESFDGRVSALDARTGTLRWSTQAGGVVMTTPIVADGVVVVGTGTSAELIESAERVVWGRPQGDTVTGLDATSGGVLWMHRTIGEDMPSPALTHVNGMNAIVFANGDDHVYALDLRSGHTIWRRDVAGIASMSSAAADRGVVFVIVGGTAYSRSGDSLLAIEPKNGKFLWRAPYGNADCSPTVAYGRVFVEGSGSESGLPPNRNAFNDVAAIDEGSGKLHWRWYSGLGTFTSVGSDEEAIAGLAGDGAFYESIPATNEFAAFDARTGRVRWKTHTEGAVKMSAVERNGLLYFGDTAGVFYVVGARNGRIVSRQSYPSYFTTSSPVIAGGTLYVANNYAVRALPLGTKRSARPSMQ